MDEQIKSYIRKFSLKLAERDGQEGVLVTLGRPTGGEIAFIRAHKPEIMAELRARKAAEEAERREKAERDAAELAAIESGATPIQVFYTEGEYLSGYTLHGKAAELLEKIGLARYVSGWGYRVDEKTIAALGKEFTYPAAVEHTRPAREAAEAKKQTAEAARAAKFAQARETGKRVELESYPDECNDPSEDCSLDMVTVYAMPDGSTKTTRNHTW